MGAGGSMYTTCLGGSNTNIGRLGCGWKNELRAYGGEYNNNNETIKQGCRRRRRHTANGPWNGQI